MATNIKPNEDTVKLDILWKYVAKMLDDSELRLVEPQLLLERRIELVGGMVATLKAGVLADHLEHKEVQYTHMELPRWLKWLDRFVIKHDRHLSLDAYHTYPKANIKLPKLGANYVDIVKQDFEL